MGTESELLVSGHPVGTVRQGPNVGTPRSRPRVRNKCVTGASLVYNTALHRRAGKCRVHATVRAHAGIGFQLFLLDQFERAREHFKQIHWVGRRGLQS